MLLRVVFGSEGHTICIKSHCISVYLLYIYIFLIFVPRAESSTLVLSFSASPLCLWSQADSEFLTAWAEKNFNDRRFDAAMSAVSRKGG